MASSMTFSDELVEKIQNLARIRKQNVDALLESLVDHAWLQEISEPDDGWENSADEAPTPEMQAYIALHPVLKDKYLGKYVAIYKGKLVDHDANHEMLYKRINARYPDEFVWISLVEDEAIPTLHFRSPRIEWDAPV